MFFFRVVPTDGRFECRRGREVLATWPTLCEAVDHCRTVAAQHPPSAVYLHDTAGYVQLVARFEAEDPA